MLRDSIHRLLRGGGNTMKDGKTKYERHTMLNLKSIGGI